MKLAPSIQGVRIITWMQDSKVYEVSLQMTINWEEQLNSLRVERPFREILTNFSRLGNHHQYKI